MNYRWTSTANTNPKNPLNWTDENGSHGLPGTGDSVLIDTEAPGLACLDPCDWSGIVLDAFVVLGNPKSGRHAINIGRQIVMAKTVSFPNAPPITID